MHVEGRMEVWWVTVHGPTISHDDPLNAHFSLPKTVVCAGYVLPRTRRVSLSICLKFTSKMHRKIRRWMHKHNLKEEDKVSAIQASSKTPSHVHYQPFAGKRETLNVLACWVVGCLQQGTTCSLNGKFINLIHLRRYPLYCIFLQSFCIYNLVQSLPGRTFSFKLAHPFIFHHILPSLSDLMCGSAGGP